MVPPSQLLKLNLHFNVVRKVVTTLGLMVHSHWIILRMLVSTAYGWKRAEFVKYVQGRYTDRIILWSLRKIIPYTVYKFKRWVEHSGDE